MNNSVLDFYEQLSSNYHLIFADWQSSVLQQAEVLDKLIQNKMQQFPLTVLDASCGIGTQAIGLAKRGYQVHATDLSPASVERARKAAEAFGVSLTFGVADLRSLETKIEGKFDVVISCDNALPHLLSNEDLQLAANNLWAKLKPNGLLIASIRDYDRVIDEKPRSTIPQVIDSPEGRRIIFQVWDWLEEGNTYKIHHFIVRQITGNWQTHQCSTQYRALLREELSLILRDAGFSDINWQMPEESGYYQPIVVARK
jgi:2-polyprenyl-3-methyl-5-hydroxy-6-metoxy-1,4-benzoquinol methylase